MPSYISSYFSWIWTLTSLCHIHKHSYAVHEFQHMQHTCNLSAVYEYGQIFKTSLSRTTNDYQNHVIVTQRDVRLSISLSQNDRHIHLFPKTYHWAYDCKETCANIQIVEIVEYDTEHLHLKQYQPHICCLPECSHIFQTRCPFRKLFYSVQRWRVGISIHVV